MHTPMPLSVRPGTQKHIQNSHCLVPICVTALPSIAVQVDPAPVAGDIPISIVFSVDQQLTIGSAMYILLNVNGFPESNPQAIDLTSGVLEYTDTLTIHQRGTYTIHVIYSADSNCLCSQAVRFTSEPFDVQGSDGLPMQSSHSVFVGGDHAFLCGIC